MEILSFDELEALAVRRVRLTNGMPKCPKCADPQVQLVNMYQNPAWWKCRKCRTRFAFEPKESV